jgi:hypothetical protein
MPYVLCFDCHQEYLKQYLFVAENSNFHFCSDCEAIWNDDGYENPIEQYPVQYLSDDSLRQKILEGQAERIFDHMLFNVEAKEVKSLILEAWSSPNKLKDSTPFMFSNYWIVEMNRLIGRFGETKILIEERLGIISNAAPVPFWHPGDVPDIHERCKTVTPINEKVFVFESGATKEDLIQEAWSMPPEFKKRLNSYSWLIDMTRVIGVQGETKVYFRCDPRDGKFIGMTPVQYDATKITRG